MLEPVMDGDRDWAKEVIESLIDEVRLLRRERDEAREALRQRDPEGAADRIFGLEAEIERLRRDLTVANGNRHHAEARLREAEAHLWALVVWFGVKHDNPYLDRDLGAAADYVERHLRDENMAERHRVFQEIARATLAAVSDAEQPGRQGTS